MATEKMTAEVEAEVEVNSEKTEIFEKPNFANKVKTKAGNGKNWISRHGKQIKTAVVAGLGVVALGAVAMVAKNKLGDGDWEPEFGSSDDDGEFTSED